MAPGRAEPGAAAAPLGVESEGAGATGRKVPDAVSLGGGVIPAKAGGSGMDTDDVPALGAVEGEAADGFADGAAAPPEGGMANVDPRVPPPLPAPGGLAVGKVPEPVSPAGGVGFGVTVPGEPLDPSSGTQNRPLQCGQTA